MAANKDILEGYVELYNAGDLAACMDLCADDAVQAMHDGVYYNSLATLARFGLVPLGETA